MGNIGLPYTKVVKQTTENSVTVAEMSSFQLETIESFRPDVSIILNITPEKLKHDELILQVYQMPILLHRLP